MSTTHKKIESSLAPRALGPYSQAVKAGNTLYVSGQIPIDPTTGKLVNEDIKSQTAQVLKNISAILKEAGASIDDVVRCDVFLIELNRDFSQMNEEYQKWFKGEVPPARQTIQVVALPLGAMVEISCIVRLEKNPA